MWHDIRSLYTNREPCIKIGSIYVTTWRNNKGICNICIFNCLMQSKSKAKIYNEVVFHKWIMHCCLGVCSYIIKINKNSITCNFINKTTTKLWIKLNKNSITCNSINKTTTKINFTIAAVFFWRKILLICRQFVTSMSAK